MIELYITNKSERTAINCKTQGRYPWYFEHQDRKYEHVAIIFYTQL